uniref:DUF38 domain-containing protein n=1 Tax=Panagrolaimus davidi TaxID=227884 RepID=A0A914P064_9BILA
MLPSEKLNFQGPYLRQNWSLPDSFIYNLAIKPSNANGFAKLVKSCKYFYSKNPVSLSPIFPKLYKTDFEKLDLSIQTISYNDFLFISSNVENIELIRVVIKNEEVPYTIVPLEKLVKALPKIKNISLCENQNHMSSIFTRNTVKELLIIPHFSKISKITLHNIPETFDIETFFAFIKKNKITKFRLYFHHSFSAAYKNCLEAIIDEILQTENHDYKVPCICFYGLEEKKWKKLQSLYDKN